MERHKYSDLQKEKPFFWGNLQKEKLVNDHRNISVLAVARGMSCMGDRTIQRLPSRIRHERETETPWGDRRKVDGKQSNHRVALGERKRSGLVADNCAPPVKIVSHGRSNALYENSRSPGLQSARLCLCRAAHSCVGRQ
jgi:hypothetical protein